MTAIDIAGIEGLSADLAVAMGEGGARFPWLQVTTYKPTSTSTKVQIILSEESVEMLTDEAREILSPEIVLCDYGEGDVTMFTLPADIRWVVLSYPRMFGMDKKTKEISPLVKGEKLSEVGKVTASKLLLGAIVGDKLLTDTSGNPQIFTLKLTSSKTALIGNANDKDEERKTIFKMNSALQNAMKKKGAWLTHLVSVEIKARSQKFTSRTTGESSFGVEFILDGSAKVLPVEAQKAIHRLITTEEFIELARNPFAAPQQDVPVDELSLNAGDPVDGIPF